MEDMERVLSGCVSVVNVQAYMGEEGMSKLKNAVGMGGKAKSWRRTRGVLLAISGEIEDVRVGATIEPKGELFEAKIAYSKFERRAEGEGEEGREQENDRRLHFLHLDELVFLLENKKNPQD
jgi:hypothetical protein